MKATAIVEIGDSGLRNAYWIQTVEAWRNVVSATVMLLVEPLFLNQVIHMDISKSEIISNYRYHKHSGPLPQPGNTYEDEDKYV